MTSPNGSTQTPRRQTELKQIESLGFGTYLTAKRKLLNNTLSTVTQNPTIMSITAGIILIISGGITITTWSYYTDLNNKASELTNLTMVNTSILSANKQTSSLLKELKNIDQIISLQQDNLKEQKRYQTIITTLQQPLTHFLEQLYLPSLNIWKNQRQNNINTNLIGKQFLEKNPYNDITLIQTRSRFFKEVGNNQQYNEVQDIRIGSITEHSDGFFSLPITLSFSSPNKRSFLFLIDKISLTSHKPNILLINEFTTNLRSAIKDQQASVLSGLLTTGSQDILSGTISTDRLIGALLSHQINKTPSTGDKSFPELLTKEVIQSAVVMSAGCQSNISIERCILQFREKYRGIPQLAYPLTKPEGDIVSELVSFYSTIPPLLQIDNFSFIKQKPSSQNKTNDAGYKGQITITVYGKGLSNPEYEEIGKALGSLCLGNNTLLTSDIGAERINAKILSLSQNISTINTIESQKFVELQKIFAAIKQQFATLGNYQKTIKTFEMYRMLNDSGLCK